VSHLREEELRWIGPMLKRGEKSAEENAIQMVSGEKKKKKYRVDCFNRDQILQNDRDTVTN
jgi:hypothetical protein